LKVCPMRSVVRIEVIDMDCKTCENIEENIEEMKAAFARLESRIQELAYGDKDKRKALDVIERAVLDDAMRKLMNHKRVNRCETCGQVI